MNNKLKRMKKEAVVGVISRVLSGVAEDTLDNSPQFDVRSRSFMSSRLNADCAGFVSILGWCNLSHLVAGGFP